ncbi:DUF2147 domain-containing protein [Paraglaciecola aquimarina]|uniref:DUF2147 domain-containing protein n=1 Tax=Paraglaciecola aquimarina TaxID=1235557 RepID=A0ABU3SYA8_9ALTE|nr:DUF2147 domain-containing protein [Paraglaciecola aquimarina]MDU0354998.1 DUF2147 domain-containing protein [Paraglaciecola aquimarina]
MKKFLALLLLSGFISNAALAADIEGLWFTENQAAQVKVYQCEDRFCGEIVWLEEPTWDQDDVDNNKDAVLGAPKIDLKNDVESLRSRPILGMHMLNGLKKVENNQYEDGKIYDAESGNTYSCEAKLADAGDKLEMTGYIGVSWFGRTTTWTRVQ